MSISLTIGNETFEYPENGSNPQAQWGEEATGWAEAVTELLNNIQSPNDVSLTTFTLNDNVTTETNIVGLAFSTTAVSHVNVEYVIERTVAGNVTAESGLILGNYDGVNFNISLETVGDSGVNISVTNTGQFQYTSSNLGHTACTIKFKGTAISS